jgi:hypothetical protein
MEMGESLRYSLVPLETVLMSSVIRSYDLCNKLQSELGINGNVIQSYRTV